ncbi:TPA: hypothetical protein DEW49_01750 [bacterium]|nr:hypothetical protein [bacterium]
MKKKGLLIVLLMFLVSSFILLKPGVVKAQSLWGKTKYGMTIEQVKEVVPNAVRPSDPNCLAKDEEIKELLRVDEIILVGDPFRVSFFFKENKLYQISLSLKEKPGKIAAETLFDMLVDALRVKYGKEIAYRKEKVKGILNNWKATWMSGRTNITLSSLCLAGEFISLSIMYQVRIAEEADKL